MQEKKLNTFLKKWNKKNKTKKPVWAQEAQTRKTSLGKYVNDVTLRK